MTMRNATMGIKMVVPPIAKLIRDTHVLLFLVRPPNVKKSVEILLRSRESNNVIMGTKKAQ